jgi:hypothetical protein
MNNDNSARVGDNSARVMGIATAVLFTFIFVLKAWAM